ncbi:PilT protein domain protein [Pyrolobus fumarii 1A]|uniref:Ribonuclease VapC n=1 Tax=Pyrolobus fumarii (strain DSM 11204 / 1A) TaxID=694429 RepID=G0EGY8_PYRF1|nr:PIN domain-containing protein [Pyrolobus fumarii]AEM38438.1 PilT protein domain protein [Pyrolobus fumarii 1A]
MTHATRVVVDTYAWVEVLRGSREGRKALEVIGAAQEVYTPSIVLVELAAKLAREGASEEEIHDTLREILEASDLVEITPRLAVEAAKCRRILEEHAKRRGLRSKPSLADAIILAAARMLGAKVLTGDKHFEGLPETIWLG